MLSIGQAPHHRRRRMVLTPKRQAALAPKVFVVEQQFFEAGPRHANQLPLEFLGGAGGLAACGYVLTSAARRLYHLVVGPRAFVDEPVTELHRGIVDQFGVLKRFQFVAKSSAAQIWKRRSRLSLTAGLSNASEGSFRTPEAGL